MLSIIAMIIIVHACGDDDAPSIIFEGITETDILGVPSGEVDESDWRSDDVWSAKEIALFSGYSNLNNDGVTQQVSGASWTAAPNPAIDQFFISVSNLDNLELAEWKIVDNGFRELTGDKFIDASSGTFFIVNLEGLATPGIYRMYYLYKFVGNEYILLVLGLGTHLSAQMPCSPTHWTEPVVPSPKVHLAP